MLVHRKKKSKAIAGYYFYCNQWKCHKIVKDPDITTFRLEVEQKLFRITEPFWEHCCKTDHYQTWPHPPEKVQQWQGSGKMLQEEVDLAVTELL